MCQMDDAICGCHIKQEGLRVIPLGDSLDPDNSIFQCKGEKIKLGAEAARMLYFSVFPCRYNKGKQAGGGTVTQAT